MPKNGRSVILIAGVIIALLILVFNVAVTVKAGEAGVLFRPFSGGVDVEPHLR